VLTTPRRSKRVSRQGVRGKETANKRLASAGTTDRLPKSPVAPAGTNPGLTQLHAGNVERPLFLSAPQCGQSAKAEGPQLLRQGHQGCAGDRDVSPCAAGVFDDEDAAVVQSELARLRRRLCLQAAELQEACGQLDHTRRALRRVQASHMELSQQHSNLERLERTSGSELLEERRKNEELSKQLKAMRQNLRSLSGDDGAQSACALQKRCSKLEQQNTQLSVQSRLLRRQKLWAEAKARVLQSEVTSVYLGTNSQVKDALEIEEATDRQFSEGASRNEDARVYRLTVSLNYKHREAVIDFLTHITHTRGKDAHGFLSGSRVFNEAIRNECLAGLGCEYYSLWKSSRLIPQILRAVEGIVFFKHHANVFEGFAAESAALLSCSHSKLWLVDHFRQSMWTCERGAGDVSQTKTLALPGSNTPSDLVGAGFAASACVSRQVVNIRKGASCDPRFSRDADAFSDGSVANSLCVPICQRGKEQVRAVLQAMDCKHDPHLFPPQVHVRILRLLGRVSMEVIDVCEATTAKAANDKRKDALLQLFSEQVPCSSPAQLLQALEQGLQALFHARMSSLHLVAGAGGPLVLVLVDHGSLSHHGLRVTRIQREGLRGLVGHAAKRLNHASWPALQLRETPHDPSIDLPAHDDTILHTVPICEGISSSSSCVAVCQFVCTERERTAIADDGTFHQENHLHFGLLNMLLTFVRKHLPLFETERV